MTSEQRKNSVLVRFRTLHTYIRDRKREKVEIFNKSEYGRERRARCRERERARARAIAMCVCVCVCDITST